MDKNTGEVRTESTQHIRDEIRHTEEEMAETIHAIEDRLSPSHLRERLVARVKEQASVGADKARNALRRNPGAAAAVGAGIALVALMSMRKRRRRAETIIPQQPVSGTAERTGKSKSGAGMLGLLLGTALAFGLPARLAEAAKGRMPGKEEPGPMAVPPGTGTGMIEEPGRIIK